MPLDDSAGDVKAKPGAGPLALACLPIPFEQVREMFRRNSSARVGDGEANLALVDGYLEAYRALVGELDCVSQYVGKDLEDAAAVAIHEGAGCGQVRLERDAFLLRERLHVEERILGQRARVADGPDDAQATGVDAADIHQVVDQPAHR